MSQTDYARRLLPTLDRYALATRLMAELGITRDHARVLIARAEQQPKPRGGARVGGGRRKKQQGDNQ